MNDKLTKLKKKNLTYSLKMKIKPMRQILSKKTRDTAYPLGISESKHTHRGDIAILCFSEGGTYH